MTRTGSAALTETQFAAFWQERREEIARITDRCEELGSLLRGNRGSLLQKTSPLFIPCHADIHTANLLVDPQGGLHIVDWDQPILAPQERDLMFVVGGHSPEEAAFFQGYGEVAIDPLALAYYRLNGWCRSWVITVNECSSPPASVSRPPGNRWICSASCLPLAMWSRGLTRLMRLSAKIG